jgi:UDP-glucose 4-epimerase
MTVLVTGGAGYIGSHMVHALVDAGGRVVVLDNLATGFDWAIAKGASLVIGDVGDRPCVAALIAEDWVDAIVHFSASTVVPDSVRNPLGYYHNNTVNSHALIESGDRRSTRSGQRRRHPSLPCRTAYNSKSYSVAARLAMRR